MKRAAVLGAGIMGGGISYQSASQRRARPHEGHRPEGARAGHAARPVKLLEKQVERGKLTTGKMARTLAGITPTLSYGDFGAVDFVVEAVVENETVKKTVLAEVEGLLPESAILTSNTSTISITRLATALKRPESFCGMHFFNPVPRMPLVEVIRGEKSSRRRRSPPPSPTPRRWARRRSSSNDCARLPRQPRALPLLRRLPCSSWRTGSTTSGSTR